MTAQTIFVKDPDADLDWTHNLATWLGTDTISTATFTVADGLTAGTGAKASSHTDTTATVWLSGGTAGQQYDVTLEVVTTAGRKDDRTVAIQVRER